MKRILSLIIAIILTFSLCGCSNDFSMKCHIGEFPSTLDPQMASSEIQMIIAHNTFEGLMRLDENNKPVPASCEDVTISADGKEYIFTIKSNLKWSNGSDLTIHDFYYGLIRAIDSDTKAPYGYLLNSIQGAKESLAGDKSTSVGINVIDNKTLKITLTEKDDNFLYNLCHPVAAPCNKEYFDECKGKYGITAKTIISNGTYKTAYLVTDNTIRISQNAYYTGDFDTECTSIEFDFKKLEEQEYYDKIADNYWGITFIDQKTDPTKIKFENFNIVDNYTAGYYLLLNPKAIGCNKQDIRKSLVLTLPTLDNYNIVKLNSYLPQDVTICGAPISIIEGISNFQYPTSVGNIKEVFLKNSNTQILNSLKNAPFYCSDNAIINDIAKSFVASWQKELGIYMNIETLSDAEMNSMLLGGNFNVALVKIESKDHTASALMNSLYNAVGKPSDLTSTNEVLSKSKSVNDSVSLINSFNISLTENCYAIPISMAASSYIYTEDYENVFINANGVIDFSYITKK